MHDCFSSNWTLEGVEHGVCNAQILQEMEALVEIEKEPRVSDMKTILLDGLKPTRTANADVLSAEHYYPAIQLVIWSNRTPEDAIQAAIADAYDCA